MRSTLMTLGLSAILGFEVFTQAGLMAQTSSSSSTIKGLIYTQIQEPNQKTVYLNLPQGLEEDTGWVVGGDQTLIPVNLVIGYLQNNRKMLRLEEVLSQQKTNHPQGITNRQTKKVLDVVEVPKNVVVLNGCDRNGKGDNSIFVFIKSTTLDDKRNQKEWLTNFEKVWQANRKTEKFERVLVKRVRCPNPRWGI
jgi:hypothetical protein